VRLTGAGADRAPWCPAGVCAAARRRDGTLVRRGVQLHRYTSLDPPLDENRLRQLLDDAFGKQLVDHYFDDIRRKEKYWIYLAGDYLGTRPRGDERGCCASDVG